MNHTIFDWTGKDPKDWVEVSTHFARRGEMTATSGDTIITAINSGTAAISTVTAHHLEIGPGSATDDKGASVQWSPKVFGLAAGKKFGMRFRGYWETAANGEGFLGVAVVDVSGTPPVVAGVTDAIGFFKAASATTLQFKIVRDSNGATCLTIDVGTIADGTYLDCEVEIEMDAAVANKGLVTLWLNGNCLVSNVPCLAIPIDTEELMCLTAENITSAAADKSLFVDLIGARVQVA